MKKIDNTPYTVNSISELHRLLSLPKPTHPLISVIDFNDVVPVSNEIGSCLVINFYSICIKKDYKGKLKYGQNYYDFDEGVMTFMSPGQTMSSENHDPKEKMFGSWIIIHSDFIRNYPLAKVIKNYGYFSYAVNEALHLSEKEESMIENIMKNIEQEYRSVIDTYSQDVMISHLELILNYSNRFYNRQFLTRKNVCNDLLIKLEDLLENCFVEQNLKELGLPTVQYIADKLNLSPNYLSDMLRTLTGQSTQSHIHNKLIEKAKDRLTTTSLSVSEIAYQLGFEYPQSFSKLFKGKTNVSPLEFRNSFN